MISEVDLRDWDQVDFTLIDKAKSDPSDEYAFNCLFLFVDQVELLRKKQIKAVEEKLPALLKGKDG